MYKVNLNWEYQYKHMIFWQPNSDKGKDVILSSSALQPPSMSKKWGAWSKLGHWEWKCLVGARVTNRGCWKRQRQREAPLGFTARSALQASNSPSYWWNLPGSQLVRKLGKWSSLWHWPHQSKRRVQEGTWWAQWHP